ncbi:DNA-packaging protein [Xanthobacter flavus]|uniref:Large terminase n=1 Tax=Xanthobacter flavus TaxID=281 RepID=A0A9W6FKM9_XANFL|nr:terminase family protein [Xanthobacter flavus]GLI23475.1 large terminase [Xanthobacter flavus]
MTVPPSNSSLADSIASLPEAERARVLAGLTKRQAEQILWDWRFWARPNQLPPPGDWLTWLILAGRGYGKTRTGAEWVRSVVCGATPLARGVLGRIALVAETAADARDVMVEGESGILSVHPKEFRPLYEPSKRRLTWPNGAVATLYNAVEPDQLRGPQHDGAWCDELAKWRYAGETWDQLQFGLRLGLQPRQVVTTTPRPIPVLKQIMAAETTRTTRGSTYENRANLAGTFLTEVVKKFEGTRLGRQELNAEVLDDVPGALWTRDMLDACRVRKAPELVRVVVAVDPSGTKGEEDTGDAIGIVAAGKGVDGNAYILEDATCKLPPAAWGRRAVALAAKWKADRIVAERNFGGAMVEHVIRSVDPRVSYREVTASRGKVARAEPVAALYEQSCVRHVGAFPEMEDQMCSFATNGYLGSGSPDRADAAVWAITELMLAAQAAAPIFGTYGTKR